MFPVLVGWTFNMNDEIVSDSEWVNAFECDPYDGVPADLPQEVLETFTDYSSDSSAPMGIDCVGGKDRE